MIGIAFIAIGVNVLRMYKRSILSNSRSVMLWDAMSVLLTGPWSFPVVLAVIIISPGTLAAFFGVLVFVTVVFFWLSDKTHAAMLERGATKDRGPQLTAKMSDYELWLSFIRDPDTNLVGLMEEKR